MANAQTTFVEQGVNGSWNTTSIWSPAGPPDGIDNTIGSINPNGTRTITLDGNHTIGNIAFTVNNNRTYIINSGAPSTSTLTLQVLERNTVCRRHCGFLGRQSSHWCSTGWHARFHKERPWIFHSWRSEHHYRHHRHYRHR